MKNKIFLCQFHGNIKNMRTINRTALSNCNIPLLPHQKYVAVVLLSGETVYFVSEVKGRCHSIFDQVCSYLGLSDCEIFSLAVKCDEDFIFVEQGVKLYKYAPKTWKNQDSGLDLQRKPLLVFYFRVQLYVDCHLLINDKTARNLYYMQLKENVCKYCQSLSEERSFLLAAFALQADIGNFQRDKHNGRYFEPLNYFNVVIVQKLGEDFIRRHTPALHKDNGGMSKGEAQVSYIKEASNETAQHNLHFYKMKRKKGKIDDVCLGISQKSLQVYEDNGKTPKTRLSNFLWADITKIHFEKKRFEICCAGIPKVRKFTYYLKNEIVAKSLFWLCRLTHQFNMSAMPRIEELKKYEIEAALPFRESYIYSDSSELQWFANERGIGKLNPFNLIKKGLNDPRKSVISNASSNTTSGIVSDRDKVHSLYESEDELDAIGIENIPRMSKNSIHLSDSEPWGNGKVRSASGDGGFFEQPNSKKITKNKQLGKNSIPDNGSSMNQAHSSKIVNRASSGLTRAVNPILSNLTKNELPISKMDEENKFKVPAYEPQYFVFEEADVALVNGCSAAPSKAASVCTLPSPCRSESVVNSAINCNVQYITQDTSHPTVSLVNIDSGLHPSGVQTLNRNHNRNVTRIGVSSLTKGRTARVPLSLFSNRQAGSEPELNHLRTWSSSYSVDSEHSLPPNMIPGKYNATVHRHSLAEGFLLNTHNGPSITWQSNTSIPSSNYSTLNSNKNFPLSTYYEPSSDTNHNIPPLTFQSLDNLSDNNQNFEIKKVEGIQSQSQLDIHQLWKKSKDMELPLLTALCNDRSLMLPKTVATCSRQRHVGASKDIRRFSCSYLSTPLEENAFPTTIFTGSQTLGTSRPSWPENQTWQNVKNDLLPDKNSGIYPQPTHTTFGKQPIHARPHSLSAPPEMISISYPILTSFGKT